MLPHIRTQIKPPGIVAVEEFKNHTDNDPAGLSRNVRITYANGSPTKSSGNQKNDAICTAIADYDAILH